MAAWSLHRRWMATHATRTVRHCWCSHRSPTGGPSTVATAVLGDRAPDPVVFRRGTRRRVDAGPGGRCARAGVTILQARLRRETADHPLGAHSADRAVLSEWVLAPDAGRAAVLGDTARIPVGCADNSRTVPAGLRSRRVRRWTRHDARRHAGVVPDGQPGRRLGAR